MPAAKKHPSARARRNTASSAAVLPAGGTGKPAPALHDRSDDACWHPRVLAWWRDLWASPMSSEYHESDVHQLCALAELYQAFWETPADAVRARIFVATEIRLQRQSFGLTPYDRRRLEWTIEAVQEAQDRGRQRRASTKAPKVEDDPRASLRVV